MDVSRRILVLDTSIFMYFFDKYFRTEGVIQTYVHTQSISDGYGASWIKGIFRPNLWSLFCYAMNCQTDTLNPMKNEGIEADFDLDSNPLRPAPSPIIIDHKEAFRHPCLVRPGPKNQDHVLISSTRTSHKIDQKARPSKCAPIVWIWARTCHWRLDS